MGEQIRLELILEIDVETGMNPHLWMASFRHILKEVFLKKFKGKIKLIRTQLK